MIEPKNGYVDNSQGSSYNSKTFYSCYEDYLLVGEEILVCEDNGEWNNLPPTCVAKCKSAPQLHNSIPYISNSSVEVFLHAVMVATQHEKM